MRKTRDKGTGAETEGRIMRERKCTVAHQRCGQKNPHTWKDIITRCIIMILTVSFQSF